MEKFLTMPKLGMTMTEGTVLQWLHQEGDIIEKGEPVLEVMTDKVNMEVEAPFTGRLTNIQAHDGDILPIGAPLATLVDPTAEETAEVPVTTLADATTDEENTPSTVTHAASTASTDSETNRAPEVQHRTVTSASSLSVIASTPAAKREAALQHVELSVIAQSGATLPLDRADVLAFVQRQKDSTTPQVESVPTAQRSPRVSPVAQKIATEHAVDLSVLAQQKQGEKIKRADVEAHVAERQEQPQTSPQTDVVPQTEHDAESELVPLSPIRRLIGQRMQQSITTAPHIYLDTEIDMTEAERCRQQVGRALERTGEPAPSLTAILIRAVATALTLHPDVNATFEVQKPSGKEAIRRWHAVHIGVAVDTEQALFTPVIRNAHQQSLPSLARELRRLAQAARQGKLRPEDMANATFTISNLGMYGIDTFHAIIAPGQSSILAVGKVTKQGVVVEDAEGERLEIHPMMKVSLSADHRMLDGASGSRFLQRVKTFLENPYVLL